MGSSNAFSRQGMVSHGRRIGDVRARQRLQQFALFDGFNSEISMRILARQLSTVASLIIFVGLGARSVSADSIQGPGFPSGVSYSGSGSGAGFTGGKTWNYTVDQSKFGSLWWGQSAGTPVVVGLNGSPDQLSFASYTSNTETFTGTSTIQVSNGSGYNSDTVFTKFVLTATGATFAAPPAGVSNDADLQITGSAFTVNYQALASFDGTTYTPADEFFNGLHTNPSVSPQIGFSGAFYWTDPSSGTVAPLPASAVAGMVLLVAFGIFVKFARRAGAAS
jgi:hypothetical protein